MDTDLRKLVGHPRECGLRDDPASSGTTVRTADPLNRRLTEQIATTGNRYAASFDCESSVKTSGAAA
ncbi:hypothetical protein GCM10010331_64860 [Streptomyces xanthochromogenes]|nr:hypothetical protein GCM10010331_64860 [Streptomyces xanthochromogenes]